MTESETTRARRVSVAPVVRLRERLQARLDLDAVPDAVGASAAAWLGEQLEGTGGGRRSFLCDLELHAGGSGPTLFRKAAIITIAEPVRSTDGWVVPIEWRAASLSPLFPVFAGELRLDEDGIELDGSYAPPGGRLGYLLDVALLGAAARQTGRWFMRLLADALA